MKSDVNNCEKIISYLKRKLYNNVNIYEESKVGQILHIGQTCEEPSPVADLKMAANSKCPVMITAL